MNHILVAFAGEKTRQRMTDIFESTGIRVSAACSSGAEVLRWCGRMNGGVVLCGIGIKICDASYQNRGLGKKILSVWIEKLFDELGAEKVVLDTNLKNTRAQHVYEELGFRKTSVAYDSGKDQLGELQSFVNYELTREQLVCFHEQSRHD